MAKTKEGAQVKVRALDLKYGNEELYEGEQIVAFRHCGGNQWSVLVAPVDSLKFLKITLEPGEPDKPMHPSES